MSRKVFGTTITMVIAVSAALAARDSPPHLTVLRQGLSRLGDVIGGTVLSADGGHVAFVSATRLLPADTNDVKDIYMFDRVHHTLTLETAAADGSASNGDSREPALSADGRFLVFTSIATNLVAGQSRHMSQNVFLRDRLTGVTRRVSTGVAGEDPNENSGAPAISDDGQVLAFVSSATNLVAGDEEEVAEPRIHLARFGGIGVTRLGLGRGSVGAVVGNPPSLSSDGRIVVFAATAARDGRGGQGSLPPLESVYAHDTVSGSTTCISCGAGRGATVRACGPHVSGNGRFVVFTEDTGGDEPQRRIGIAVHDLTSSVTTRITRSADGYSTRPGISADGRFVVFESVASNLACQRRCSADSVDANLLPDIYLFDRQTGRFRRVSGGQQPWWVPSIAPSIDARGRVVIFSSRQPVGPEDPSTDFDLFVWSLGKD